MWFDCVCQYRLVDLSTVLKELLNDLMAKSENHYNVGVWLTDIIAEYVLNKLQCIVWNNLIENYLFLVA
jgi:hypothetical protein